MPVRASTGGRCCLLKQFEIAWHQVGLGALGGSNPHGRTLFAPTKNSTSSNQIPLFSWITKNPAQIESAFWVPGDNPQLQRNQPVSALGMAFIGDLDAFQLSESEWVSLLHLRVITAWISPKCLNAKTACFLGKPK